ncbi:hypothetical protein [Cardinium endosymbiont of Culicoides punctatus]|uniref:hypothetical protein n=1 Tax=Cardinium endosymbiont of Culicoides punctatus TaxID=2304601 RepID=UPI00105893C9|nr:hypothetical protein [Cardinium endosymbiont of Culicoides punctatus]
MPIESITCKNFTPTVSISDCSLLGSIGYMEGKKKSFLLQCQGHISNKPYQTHGYVAIVGLCNPSKNSTSILTQSMECKNQIGHIVWQENGDFVVWNKENSIENEKIIIDLDETAYKKLCANSYDIYMAYAQDDATYLCHSVTPVKFDIQSNTFPDYTAYKLEALSYGTQQVSCGTDWLLKGSITPNSFPKHAKMGFILVNEKSNASPYDMVHKVLASGEAWPTTPTLFSDCIIVPGNLRAVDHIIEGHLLSEQLPIKKGKFKIFCYLMYDCYYYISQMEYVYTDANTNTAHTACPPPEITFTGETYHLALSDLIIYLKLVSASPPVVNLSDFKIQCFVNNETTSLPTDVEVCLLFLQKGSIWRTNKIENLYKGLVHTCSNMSDDASLCLVANGCKQLTPVCSNFFRKNFDYECFICLFSKKDKRLIFYTERQEANIKIEEVKVEKPIPILEEKTVPTSVQKPIDIKIGIKTPGQLYIEKNQDGTLQKLIFTCPEVSVFNSSGVNCEGFIMAQNEPLSNIDRNKQLISKFLKNNNDSIHEEEYLVFKKSASDSISTYIKDLYPKTTWMQKNQNQLSIIYWIQYADGNIVFSEHNPLSVEETLSAPENKGWFNWW